jgi:hypothetical protein
MPKVLLYKTDRTPAAVALAGWRVLTQETDVRTARDSPQTVAPRAISWTSTGKLADHT